MEFCVNTCPSPGNIDIVKLSEDLGFTHHGFADGPLLFSDPFVMMALAASQTSTIKLGTSVTNPLTRIPAVLTNALATLNEAAPGRIFFGIGTANNAVKSMGAPAATIAEIEDGIRQFKGLMTGQRVSNTWRGDTKDIQFLTPDFGWYNIKDRIPIWQAVGGPKMLKSAAKYADAIIYCTGPDPTFISLVRRLIDEAAAEHGRDGKEIKLVCSSFFALRKTGDTVEDAMREGFGNGAVIAAESAVGLMKQHRELFSEQMVGFAEAANTSYRPDGNMDHLDVFKTHATGVIAPRHIAITTEEAARYFCLWGDYEEIAERVAGMIKAGCDIPCVQMANPMNYRRDITQLAKALRG
jgi:alkanesulfonate monooxygenase SsuD/methylene tetrahydromethanopterin reductase-like flavin-dependent oxidoreductase (luciferase family)